METIGLRELSQNPSPAVARVRAGESLLVTDREKLVADGHQYGVDPVHSYGIRRLRSLGAINLVTTDPFLTKMSAFVTYDDELAAAAGEPGLPVLAPA